MPAAKTVWRFGGTLAAAALVIVGATIMSTAGDDLRPLREAADKIEPLHHKKRPPGPSDWRASHRERGQTFDAYRRYDPHRPIRRRTTLYVQPIGEFGPKLQVMIKQTSELLSRFYERPVHILDPLGLDVIPAEARRVHPTWGDRQILSTYVLDEVLLPHRPEDAAAVLALTTSDLWPGKDWNFVFGQASLKARVGVWSLYRYGDPEGDKAERRQFCRRMFKVAVHETGHMLGLGHCTFYECCMNGSNHLDEMDSRPLWFCPEDEQKVWWACRADPARRYERLAEYAEQMGLKDEAGFWRESARRLR